MKKGISVVLSLILVLSIFLVACGKSDDSSSQAGNNNSSSSSNTTTTTPSEPASNSEPQILRLNNFSEPGYFHPGLARGTHDSWVLEHIMEGLTKKGPDGTIQPGMAEDWDISDDFLTYTFYLRDAVWSNGDPVTAYDFEYAWKYALSPEAASEYAYQLFYIKNGEEYNSGKVSADEVAIKVIDDKTLQVTLIAPTGYFLELLSFYTYYPVNKNVATQNPDWYKNASTYVSNGPFYLAEWNHNENIVIKKFPDYYESDLIKLEEIHFAIIADENTMWQMYQAGELDFAYPLPADVIPTLVDNPEYSSPPDLSTYYYNINTTLPGLKNKKVRKALALAIDREAIVNYVTQGGQLPASSLTPPGIPDVSGDFKENTGVLYSYDPETAKQLLAEGLAEEGLDSLSVTILYNQSTTHKAVAEAVQQMWKEILGINVELEVVEFQVKLDREVALDYEVSRAGWIGDYIDPMTFMDMFVTGGGNNNTGWSNAEYDRLIAQAKSTADNSIRMANMHKAEEILADEMPIIPIYYYTKPQMLKSYVKGVYYPVNSYPQFQYAYIEK